MPPKLKPNQASTTKTKARQKNKSSVNWKKFMNRLVMVVLLLFAVGYGVYLVFKPPTDMFQLRFTTIPLTTEHAAVLLRDEMVVTTSNPGVFKPTAKDGQRVKRNDIVGVLEVVDGAEIPDHVDMPLKGSKGLLVDEDVLKGEAQAIYQAMVDALRRGRYSEAENMKRELEFKLERLSRLQAETSENAFYLQAKKVAQVGDVSATVGSQLAISSVEAGTISLSVDGFEESVTFDNRYQIDFVQLFDKDIPLVTAGEAPVAFNEPIFKIITQDRWYLACQIAQKDFDLYDKESKIDILINGERVEGRVQETFASGSMGVLILRIQQPIAQVYALRSTRVSLVSEEVEGLVIPKGAIVDRGGQKGVFTTDQEGRIVFKPIHLIAEKDDQSIVVHEGHFTRVDNDGKLQQVPTVQHGEKILKNPTGKKEGDKLAP